MEKLKLSMEMEKNENEITLKLWSLEKIKANAIVISDGEINKDEIIDRFYKKQGVYFLFDNAMNLLYVGCSNNDILERLRTHLSHTIQKRYVDSSEIKKVSVIEFTDNPFLLELIYQWLFYEDVKYNHGRAYIRKGNFKGQGITDNPKFPNEDFNIKLKNGKVFRVRGRDSKSRSLSKEELGKFFSVIKIQKHKDIFDKIIKEGLNYKSLKGEFMSIPSVQYLDRIVKEYSEKAGLDNPKGICLTTLRHVKPNMKLNLSNTK